jgi:hypothetical protein
MEPGGPEMVFLNLMEPRNQFHVIDSAGLCSLAARYDNPIPAQFLAPIDCLKIPALYSGRTKYSAFVSKLNKLSEEYLSPQKTQKAAFFFSSKDLRQEIDLKSEPK